ncbi:PhzF family phenazine biosynthesis isomerase [Dactylosporangium sp. NPDC000244]|uniref:PhzF family phenazine biosynthesis isomerase n=1 Tax=Dactylosporangium sp. NPDC000244 TaxID=3154365 RepID=UPI00332E0B7D
MTEFAYVDVFAAAPLTGAPLTLVPDADGLSDAQLRAIAREFNQSETTFVLRSDVATRRLRSFTPTGEEVFGAGHNALGAWLWLAESLLEGDSATFHQQIGADILPVYAQRRDDGRIVISMEQSPPVFGASVADRAGLAAALGLGEDDLVPDRAPRVVSTGAGHLLVPVRSRTAVDRAAVHADALVAALRAVGGEGCYVFTLESGVYARFFNPAMGIPEDPATGTAAGPLAALLVADGLAGPDVVIEQGHAMGRPSRILVTVDGPRVLVRGSGVVTAAGTLTIGPRPPVSADDERFLLRAIELATRARAAGEAPFGSLLVDAAGTVLAEEHNTVASDGDITAHPELKLARWAARHLAPAAAAEVTMYTSCQPCGMCTGAIDRSGLGRVVYALSTAQLGRRLATVAQDGPALHASARAAVEGFYA